MDMFNFVSENKGNEYKSVITQASLTVLLSHDSTFERNVTAKYLVKTFSVFPGHSSAMRDNLFLSQTPYRVIMGLQTVEQFNGIIHCNPFCFVKHGLNYLIHISDFIQHFSL